MLRAENSMIPSLVKKLIDKKKPAAAKTVAAAPAVRARSKAAGKHKDWFEIPGEYFGENGVIRVLESSDVDLATLLESFREKTYTKPFIVDDGETRRLHFDLRYVQSAMTIKQPDELLFAYTQSMMAFLLFAPSPRHVVVVGLGGGSLTRYCYQQLPRARITTIEIDEHIIALCEMFDLPPPDRRNLLLRADAVEYFASTDEIADVVLIDACDAKGVAPAFCKPAFYRTLRERLSPRGVAVINLIGIEDRVELMQRMVSGAFDGHCLSLKVKGGNQLLFAFNDVDFDPDWDGIRRRAEILESRTQIEFVSLARRLKRSWKRDAVGG
jgi:spermidine synthase